MNEEKLLRDEKLLDDVEKAFVDYEIAKKNAYGKLVELLINDIGIGNPLTFNDESGYPLFNDSSLCMLQDVLAIKVEKNHSDGKNVIMFNNDASECSLNGVDDDCWYIPEECGDYDMSELFNVVATRTFYLLYT